MTTLGLRPTQAILVVTVGAGLVVADLVVTGGSESTLGFMVNEKLQCGVYQSDVRLGGFAFKGRRDCCSKVIPCAGKLPYLIAFARFMTEKNIRHSD